MVSLRRGRATAFWAAVGFLAVGVLTSGDASAQGVFCPTVVGGVPNSTGNPFALASGRCTNGNAGTGAFSGAALGSQSLSDLASGSTETTNRAASGMVNDRRQAEQQRCPAGTSRVNGECRSTRSRQEAEPRARGKQRMVTETRMVKRGNKMVRTRVRVPAQEPGLYEKGPVAAPIYMPVDPTVRIGTFAQGFGDYEERTGRSQSNLAYSGILGNVTVPLTILTKSRATLTGFLGGIDFTSRGLLEADDGLIVGVLGGYSENNVRITSQVLSGRQDFAGNGSSTLTSRASGGSVGVFATYFSGPLSLDGMYKVDFYNLNERFNDIAAFTLDGNLGTGPFNVPLAGSGSTNLRNHSILANFNYRIPLYGSFWMEPTAGLQARWTDYGSSAAQLGLADGHLFRLQAGARLGWDLDYGTVRITPIITGLAYSDVSVRGGFVDFAQTGTFGATTQNLGVSGTSIINIRQEGLLRGQGIFTLVGDFGNGMTAFVQGDVRGGKDLFGAGGKAGLRYQW